MGQKPFHNRVSTDPRMDAGNNCVGGRTRLYRKNNDVIWLCRVWGNAGVSGNSPEWEVRWARIYEC